VRALPEDLNAVEVPQASTLVLLGRDGVLIEHGAAEHLGEVDPGCLIRMAIERPNYPYEVWSRPNWRWPVAEREAA
jgi:hypothetical protein